MFGLIAGLSSAPVRLIVAAVRIQRSPALVNIVDHPTNIAGALDLWLVVPFGMLGGIWLALGRGWGYVVTTLWTVKASAYMLALSSAVVAARAAGAIDDAWQLMLWVPIAVSSGVGAAVLLRACPQVALAAGLDGPPWESGPLDAEVWASSIQ
jgi:hypothetical protein